MILTFDILQNLNITTIGLNSQVFIFHPGVERYETRCNETTGG